MHMDINIPLSTNYKLTSHLKVLEGLSFDKFKPELVCVEIHEKKIKQSDIYKFLADKNYELLWSGVFSHIFKRLEN